MPYFHVLAATADEPNVFRCIAVDLSEKTLQKTVVSPYKRGKPVLLEGRIYATSDLRGIRIVRTVHEAELTLDRATYETKQEFARMNLEITPGTLNFLHNGYDYESIGDLGEIVTDQFISAAPGEGGLLRLGKAVVDHPWVTALFMAIITEPFTEFGRKLKAFAAGLWFN